MILNQDQIDCINRHVQREGRDIVREYVMALPLPAAKRRGGGA